MRFSRSLAIVRVQRQLERRSYPRLQMGLIVGLTGAAGLFCSFLLLHAGVVDMARRYPLALVGAYLFFLFLLWLWLRTNAADYVEPDLGNFSIDPDGSAVPDALGGGGDFGGGGATGSFDAPGAAAPADAEPLSAMGDAAGASLDFDELAIPIIAIGLAVGLALASLYVVYLAPTLFAEMVFDGLLSYTLYRRLRRDESSHWIAGAMRRTAAPFALTALFLWLVGAAMSHYAPGAHTIGEAMRQAQASR